MPKSFQLLESHQGDILFPSADLQFVKPSILAGIMWKTEVMSDHTSLPKYTEGSGIRLFEGPV